MLTCMLHARPHAPVAAQWTLYVYPSGGWQQGWLAPALAAVVILSCVAAVLLFCLLLSRWARAWCCPWGHAHCVLWDTGHGIFCFPSPWVFWGVVYTKAWY